MTTVIAITAALLLCITPHPAWGMASSRPENETQQTFVQNCEPVSGSQCRCRPTNTGSVIKFESSPSTIATPLTRSLNLRCELADDPTIDGENRDVSKTAENVRFVTSIVITRNNGEHVGSVTQVDPAKALADLDNIKATGEVAGLTRKTSFLDLYWDYPKPGTGGNYTCEVNAITNQGHNVIFSSRLEVKVTAPSDVEVVNNVAALHKQMDQMLSLLTTPAHTEQGLVECGDSDQWSIMSQTGDSSNRKKSISHTVTFQKPYDQVPKVHLGIVRYHDRYNSNGYSSNKQMFSTELKSVDQQGFTVECDTLYNNSNDRIYNMTISWLSMP